MGYRPPDRGRVREGVQQDEVVDCAIVAGGDNPHASRSELAGVGFTLVAQHVILADDDKRVGKILQLIDSGVERARHDLSARRADRRPRTISWRAS